ncbi:hypothetical protein B0H14DRAFT_855582 [Mycena olivaceomarginata]|nr:hypothetical protein B0H14DRAFT_855582 [Mycena olivaceomarginata]
MRVISYLSLFSSCLAGTRALVISTPQFLTAGPARINFTKEEGDPAGAFFNIAVASNASRLADDVDLSAGFVDVDILVLPGTYSIFAFGNDTGGGRDLGSTEDFPVIDLPTSPPVSATGSSPPSMSPTSASQSPSSSAAGPSSTTALDSAASRHVLSQRRRPQLIAHPQQENRANGHDNRDRRGHTRDPRDPHIPPLLPPTKETAAHAAPA